MDTLSIDIETYSSVDLTRSGVYGYTASKDFDILLFAYAEDEGPVKIVDLASGERIPSSIIEAIKNPKITKRAFNAAFERVCLSVYLKEDLKPEGWRCTAILAGALGYPLSLQGASKAMNLPVEKMAEGKALIRFFSMASSSDRDEALDHGQDRGISRRNLPHHWKEKWNLFKDYCKRDVEVERAISDTLKNFKLSSEEQRLYELDQRINERGVLVDLPLVDRAIQCDYLYKNKVLKESEALLSTLNPKSPGQVKEFLKGKGIEVDSLSKQVVEKLIEEVEFRAREIQSKGQGEGRNLKDREGPFSDKENLESLRLSPEILEGEKIDNLQGENLGNSTLSLQDLKEIKKVLKLRLKVSKTSIKKYEAIKRGVSPDNRVRGLFQFYGANRTGRWAGRLVQVQNLPQNHHKDLDLGRTLLREGRFQELEENFKDVPHILSQLIRTAFVPKEGHEFIVADFSAIEARVLAWLAGEQWRIKVFEGDGKIYEASASKMFNVPQHLITKESDLRQKGKIAELALGYGGSVGALTAMGALDMGLQEEELKPLVQAFRSANPNITRFWWDINSAVIRALREKRGQQVGRIKIYTKAQFLFIELPSGRRLSYVNPRLSLNNLGKTVISYEGITTGNRWGSIESYGPKFVENIVQGISRDILGEAMVHLEENGHNIVLHVHDEVVIEAPIKSKVKEISTVMERTPFWAKGLILKVEGFSCDFYRK